MIRKAARRARKWICERQPDGSAPFATATLLILTATGSVVLWLHFLPRQINLAISGVLFVGFILLPLRYGFLGSFISAAYLLSGAVFTTRAWVMNGDAYYLAIAVFQLATAVSGFIVGSLVERVRARNKELERAAIVDGLTGLYNHKHFVFRMQQELARQSRTDGNVALMYVDLDNFKPVNDTYGHQQGDVYLRAFAELLLGVIRTDDTAYRLGGDEFAVILPGTGEIGARKVGERLKMEMVRHDLGLPENAARPSASIGISVAPVFSETAAELMTQADSALYQAKHAGRDQIRLFQDVFADILHYFSSGDEHLVWSLKSLLWSAAVRDNYTYGHSERVAEYAAALAVELGLPPSEVVSIRIAAILHDIGRVQIPQEVLLKPGPLTEAEHAIVRRHPEYAVTILLPLSGIGTVIDDVRHHHERMDGTGYPAGLSGHAIPLGARIIAVADAFDAMCTTRPYRRALSLERVLREINAAARTGFDPVVVEVAASILPGIVRRSRPPVSVQTHSDIENANRFQ